MIELDEEEEQMIWAFQHGVFGKGRGFRGKIRGGRGAPLARGRGVPQFLDGGRGRSRGSAFRGRGRGRGRGDFIGSGPNHILGKTKYFPGKYGFAAAGSSSDSSEEDYRTSSYRNRRSKREDKENPIGKIEVAKWDKLTSSDNSKLLQPVGNQEKINIDDMLPGPERNKAINGRASPDYNKGGEFQPVEEIQSETPWWENHLDVSEKNKENEPSFEQRVAEYREDPVFNPKNEKGFKPLPQSKFHPSFAPAKTINRQINVNITSTAGDLGQKKGPKKRRFEPIEEAVDEDPLRMQMMQQIGMVLN